MKKFNILLSVALLVTVLFTACEPKCPICDDNDDNNNGIIPDEVVINGVKWATRNVGARGTFATNPEDYGNLYTWQEAQTACPSGWRLPTQSEFESLMMVSNTWTMQGNINGRKFGDSNNNIFLPAAGVRDNDGALGYVGSDGHYWGSSAGWYFAFERNSTIWISGATTYGRSVRCVAQ